MLSPLATRASPRPRRFIAHKRHLTWNTVHLQWEHIQLSTFILWCDVKCGCCNAISYFYWTVDHICNEKNNYSWTNYHYNAQWGDAEVFVPSMWENPDTTNFKCPNSTTATDFITGIFGHPSKKRVTSLHSINDLVTIEQRCCSVEFPITTLFSSYMGEIGGTFYR